MKRLLTIGWMFVLAAIATMAAPAPAAATPPSPPCVWPGSPLNYVTELLASESWGRIRGWPIRRVDVSFCAYMNSPFTIPIQVQAPAEYSAKNATYLFTATFVFQDGRMTNDGVLSADLDALRQRIGAFENNALARQYLAIAAQPVIEAYGAGLEETAEQFELKINTDNRIAYDPNAGRPTEFEFADPALIAHKAQIVPLIGRAPIAQEFDRLVGINYVHLFSDGLIIAQAPPSQCTTCESYIHLTNETGPPEYFSVPSDLAWDSLPMIGRAHAAIEQQGYDRQQPSCVIGRGSIHNYSLGRPSDRANGAFDIEVILECSNATRPVGWKQVRVQINANGTFAQPTIVMESIN